MNKSQLNKTLSTLGFKVPKHRLISNLNSISDIDFFPVIVKPSGFSSGSKDVFIAQTAKELLGIAQYFGLGSYINDFIVEEYIGTSKNEFTVGVLHDLDGNFIDTIALNRDLTGGLNVRASVSNHTKKEQLGDRLVVSSGISQGVLGKFKLITDQCRAIAEALESRGPLNIQCRVVDGVVHVFEINPRHSGTTSLRAMVGFNEPDLLIRRHLLGQTVEIDQDWPSVRIERTLTEEMILNK
jgi:carbamoyl-phosphate synthase large subunit